MATLPNNLVIYRQKNYSEWFALQVGDRIAVNQSIGELITNVIKATNPATFDVEYMKRYPFFGIDTLTKNIICAPSHLTAPAPAQVSLHQATSEALANAAEQPAKDENKNKPFAIGPAVLVSDQCLALISRCGVCHLGVINAFQQSCGRKDCPYTADEKTESDDDNTPF